MKHPNIG